MLRRRETASETARWNLIHSMQDGWDNASRFLKLASEAYVIISTTPECGERGLAWSEKYLAAVGRKAPDVSR